MFTFSFYIVLKNSSEKKKTKIGENEKQNHFFFFEKEMTHVTECSELKDWKDIDIPIFDNMVHQDQLFQLCAIIGGTLVRKMQEMIVFYGDCGKTTMCKIIETLAAKRGIKQLSMTYGSIEDVMKHDNPDTICYFPEGISPISQCILVGKLLEWRPMWKLQMEYGYWHFPTFVCSQSQILSPNVYNILMKTPETKNRDFLASIPFDLVEKKCLLAYQKFRSMLSNPNLDLLNKIDKEKNLVMD